MKKLTPLLLSFLTCLQLSAVEGGEIGMGSLRAAAGDLYAIPGLGSKGRKLADEIYGRIDTILKEYVQR